MNSPTPSGIVSVAKKDFRDAARSKLIVAIGVLFVLAESLAGVIEAEVPKLFPLGGGPAADEITRSIAGHVSLFVGVVAIIIAYRSLSGERESGSLKFLLSLPNSRLDVVLGKLIGRTAVLWPPLIVGVTTGTVVGWWRLGSADLEAYFLALGAVLLFSFMYVSVVVAFSASTKSSLRTIAMAIAFLGLFHVLWNVVPAVAFFAVEYVSAGFVFPDLGELQIAAWPYLIEIFSPVTAFDNTLNLITAREPSISLLGTPQNDPVYLTNWMGPISLALWAVVPLAIGYIRFELADL